MPTITNSIRWILKVCMGQATVIVNDRPHPAPTKYISQYRGQFRVKNEAFKGITDPFAVVIEGDITAIGKEAFSGCERLTSVTIPDSVKEIGDGAFKGCASLTSVSIPQGVTIIGKEAFCGCDNLKKLGPHIHKLEEGQAIIPDTVTTIGEKAFKDCAELSSIQLPSNDSFMAIEKDTFKGCAKLTSVKIQSVTTIGEGTFFDCAELKSIQLPANDCLKTIGKEAFCGCDNLKKLGPNIHELEEGQAIIPNKVTTIGDGAFMGCAELSSIQLPANVGFTVIGKEAFCGCDNLKKLGPNLDQLKEGQAEIPKAVTMIGDGAFMGCAELRSIQLPANDGFTMIGKEVFSGCSKLSKLGQVISRVVEGHAVIPAKVNTIGDSAFEGCIGLKKVQILGERMIIEKEAFFDCNNLALVENLDHVTTIGEGAFYGCNLSEDIIRNGTLIYLRNNQNGIPRDVEIIGENVFRNHGDLTEITIPDSVSVIGFGAFSGCSKLKSVVLPPNVKTIKDEAFLGCKALECVDVLNHKSNSNRSIEPKMKTIGSAAFFGCCRLNRFGTQVENGHAVIPDSVGTIGNEAFAGCSGLTHVLIPEGVTAIGFGAFDDCQAQINIRGNKSILHFADMNHLNADNLRTTNEVSMNQHQDFIRSYGYGILATRHARNYDVQQILDDIVDWILDKDNYNKWLRIPYMWPMRHGRARNGTKAEADTIRGFAKYALQNIDRSDEFYHRIKGILKWGGIRNIAPARCYAKAISTMENNTPLSSVLKKGEGNSGNHDWRIASWSKVLAAYKPGKLFIYDSRVALALAFITWKLKYPVFWRIPTASDGKGITDFKEKINPHRDRQADQPRITPEAGIPTCYRLYLDLLNKVAERMLDWQDLFDVDPETNNRIREAYENDAGFGNDREGRKKAIMAHLEKMLFMMKERIFRQEGIIDDDN